MREEGNEMTHEVLQLTAAEAVGLLEDVLHQPEFDPLRELLAAFSFGAMEWVDREGNAGEAEILLTWVATPENYSKVAPVMAEMKKRMSSVPMVRRVANERLVTEAGRHPRGEIWTFEFKVPLVSEPEDLVRNQRGAVWVN